MYKTLITAERLQAHLGDEEWRLFDCRFYLHDTQLGYRNYLESHIPGAAYADVEHDLSGPVTDTSGRHPLPDVTKLMHWLGCSGVHADCQVVVYDDTGGSMAARLWWLLRWLGHEAVAVLDGGWQAWLEAGYDITNNVLQTARCRFHGQVDNSMLVSTTEVAANLLNQEFLLLDVRIAERFRGEQEPIDPVAGHIPQAVNLPLTENLLSDGCFKTAERLRLMYADLLGEFDSHKTVVMCGSGVTACQSLLAMQIAGLEGARLYAGSWSEWISDPKRPVAKAV